MTDLFDQPVPDPTRKLPRPCNRPNYAPHNLAPAHSDDVEDAVALKAEANSRFACCAVHYVQHLRWKFELSN